MAARKRYDYQEEVKKLLLELDLSAAEIAKKFAISRRMVYYIAGSMGIDMDERTRKMRLQRRLNAITDEMVTRAYHVLLEETSPPYSADARDFTDEDVKNGLLHQADNEANQMNRYFVRRMLEAAISETEDDVTT